MLSLESLLYVRVREGHNVTILLNMHARTSEFLENQLDKMRINEYINNTSRLDVSFSAQ